MIEKQITKLDVIGLILIVHAIKHDTTKLSNDEKAYQEKLQNLLPQEIKGFMLFKDKFCRDIYDYYDDYLSMFSWAFLKERIPGYRMLYPITNPSNLTHFIENTIPKEEDIKEDRQKVESLHVGYEGDNNIITNEDFNAKDLIKYLKKELISNLPNNQDISVDKQNLRDLFNMHKEAFSPKNQNHKA